MSTTVLLVDDHTVVREGLSRLLKHTPGINVIGEAAEGREAVEMATRLKPQVLVMDIAMPGFSGTDATREILAVMPTARILVLSAFGDRAHVLGALRVGAAGYILKDSATHELVEAIQTVAKGASYVSPSLSNCVILDSLVNAGGAKNRLTGREREVLTLLAEGKAMKQVGQVLQISTKTVETHRRSVMEKLQLFSTAELTKHAVREGMTTLD